MEALFMKFLFLSLLALSFNSFAETTILRTFDGKNARCEIKGDVGKRFYKLKLESEKLVDERREIDLKVLFYACAEVDGKFAPVPTAATETTESYVLLANGELGKTKNTLLAANFAATDKNEVFLGKVGLNLNSEDSVIHFSFDKNLDRAFITAAFKSKIELPDGTSIDDVFEYLGGFVLKF